MAQPHPLLLPNVLSQVFTHFSPEDLKPIRLVNVDWNHAASISISKRKTVTFTSSNSLHIFRSLFHQSLFCPHSAYNFHYKMSSLELQGLFGFFSDFAEHIRSISLTIGSGFFMLRELQDILSKVKGIEHLGIRLNYFKCLELEEENAVIQIDSLPKLKSMTIEIQSYDESNYATNLLRSIFLASPNLNQIQHPLFCIPPTKCRISSQMNFFLTELVLEEGLSRKYLPRLTFLNFITKVNNDSIRHLINKSYQLKHLYIDLWNPHDEDLCVTPSSLKQLVAQSAPSLEKLGLEFPWRRDVAFEFVFELPMRNLEYLSLNGFQGSFVTLLKKLPNLKNIELSQIDLFEILPAAQNLGTFISVEKLRLDFCTNQFPGIISRLSRIFPRLRSLDVNHTTNDICRMIFKRMFTLNHLRLHGDELTDEGLTGIPYELAKENKLTSTTTVEEGNALRQYSFIGNLPCLQHLKLEAYQLSETCIKHGIAHCSSLQFVSMDTRLEKDDPSATVTRTFKLSEYGKKLVDGDQETILILQEEVEDEDESAEAFFKMYENGIGMVTDLLFA